MLRKLLGLKRTSGVFSPSRIPVFQLRGQHPGKKLLITAGMDGDEYTGIEAAYTLAKKYRESAFTGSITVIPLLNIDGFESESSINPVDHKFPKFTFPGDPRGTATEQMMHWLLTTYAYSADCWVDLHSAAMTESAPPFVWMYETGTAAVDNFTRTWVARSGASYAVCEKAQRDWQASVLAQHECAYLLLEAGERGNREPDAILQHLRWTESIMQSLSMTSSSVATTFAPEPVIFKKVARAYAPAAGIYRPAPYVAEVKAGEVLGTYTDYLNTSEEYLRAPCTGRLLWRKETMAMRPHDTLAAIAY